MTTYTITNGRDSSALNSSPTSVFGARPSINIGLSASLLGFVYFPLPADIKGATISSATLAGHAFNAFGASTVTSKPITSSWADTTLTWNNQPTVGAASVNTSVPAVSNIGDPVNIDWTALIQAVASGAAWFGVRMSASPTGVTLFSFDSSQDTPLTLTIVTQDAPDKPTALVPNGTVVAQAKPTLTCDFTDNGGLSNDMAAIQVQIDPAQNGTTPAFDSGTVATTLPLLDLTTTSYAGLASGSTTSWRVRVQDTDGLWSAYSDWKTFTYRPQPTLTLLTPAAGVLWDPTTDIVASTSANMSAYRVQITDGTDRTKIRFDSGRLPVNPSAPTTIDVALPQEYEGSRILVDDRDYQLHVQAWDIWTTRQSTPGSPTYVESWSTFHFDDDGAVTPITTLTADQATLGPGVTLTWTRASAPDAWVVLRDLKVIARLDPVDVITGVSTWSWTDPHPSQWVLHGYDIKAITGGHQSHIGPTAIITPQTPGVWIYTDDGHQVCLDATGTDQLAVNDRRDIYKPLNLRYDVDIVHGFEGISGTVTGTIPSGVDDSVELADATAVLLSIKENPSQPVSLVYGTFAGRVLLRNVAVLPHPQSTAAVPLATVSFGVNQVGDFDSVV